MQTFRFAPVPLLLLIPCALPNLARAQAPDKPSPKLAKPPKLHVVILGAIRRVPYTPPDVTPDTKDEDTTSIKIRPLIVDERQREWTLGDLHDVTDRTFTIRRALHLNDALPRDREPRWVWQPGPWLLVDRVTGHITALHLPDFDPEISNATWYRDYAAYCGPSTSALKSGQSGLYAIVTQLGTRRPAVSKQIAPWPQPNHFIPVCAPAEWQRLPLRVTLKPTGGTPLTFDLLGTSSLIEDNDPEDPT